MSKHQNSIPAVKVLTQKITPAEVAAQDRSVLAIVMLENAMLTAPEFKDRIKAAELLLAYGIGRPNVRVVQDIHVRKDDEERSPVLDHIADAKARSDLMRLVTEYSRKQIPFEMWPEDVKNAMGVLNGAMILDEEPTGRVSDVDENGELRPGPPLKFGPPAIIPTKHRD